MPKSEKIKAIIISETHWDRAWYCPFQEFRTRLVQLTDELIDILQKEKGYKSFTFDGQTVIIEDYLQIKPQNRLKLEGLVKSKRLYVGPWYVLPDEFLEGAEAMVRNLMIGHKISSDLGHTMKIGYIPDPFGHIRQLPQILLGFGIDSMVFMRGVGEEGEYLGNEFFYEAPDGSKVYALWQRQSYCNASGLGYPFGWGNFENLKFSMNLAVDRIKQAVEGLRPHARSNVVTLYNGCDHVFPQRQLPKIIEEANKRLEGVNVVHGNLYEYLADVKKVSARLDTYSGELSSGKYMPILQSVFSSRIYLKQQNEEIENLLHKYVEPIRTFAWAINRADYPTDFIWHSWRTLIKNHPHDDICGCSVDKVHKEMDDRFDEVRQIGRILVNDGLRALSNSVDTSKNEGMPLFIFNPLGIKRTDPVNDIIYFDGDDDTYKNFVIKDAKGKVIDYHVEGVEATTLVEVLKHVPVQAVKVKFIAEDVPAAGYKTYYVTNGKAGTSQTRADKLGMKVSKNAIENDFFKVRINRNGSLTVTDKATRTTYNCLNIFEDTEDAGDEYNYSHIEKSETITTEKMTANVKLIENEKDFVTFQIKLNLRLPASLTDDRKSRSKRKVACPITSLVTVYRIVPRIDVKTTILNNAKDHRFRALFPTNIKTDKSYADGHFDVVTRDIKLPKMEGWLEQPSPTKHQKTFVDLTDGKKGLAILNNGLPEYEIVRKGGKNIIALTLLRSVGWLSRGDFLTRPGNAGPSLPAPDAQCLGERIAEYSIVPHAGDYQKANLIYHGLRHNNPLKLFRAKTSGGTAQRSSGNVQLKEIPREGILPEEMSFVTIAPENLILSAIKKSERRKAIIVRVYNPTDKTIAGKICLFKKIRKANLVNLNEEVTEPIPLVSSDGRSVKLNIGRRKIATLELSI